MPDISFQSGSSSLQNTNTVGTPVTTSTQTTQVIDNQWEQDSISSLFIAGPQGLFKNLPNNPALPRPDQNLVNQAQTISQLMNNFAARVEQQKVPEVGKFPNDTILNQAYDTAFENIIKDMPNAKELRFAHYTSLPGTPRTAEEQKAFEQVLTQFGITSQEFNPVPNKTDFVEEASLQYDEEFNTALENQKPPLTEEQKAELKYLHYNPNSTFKGSEELKNQLAALEQEASSNTAEKFGIPIGKDGKIPINFQVHTSMYVAQQNGFYQEYLQQNTSEFLNANPLNANGKPWTSAEKQMLQQFMNDETTAVPEFIKAAGTQIKNASIAEVVKQFHLENIGFTPVALGTFPNINPVGKNALRQGEDIFAEGLNVTNAIPPNGPNGPLRTVLMDILKKISIALGEFKLSLYEGQGATSEQARIDSKAKLEMALNQIKENVKEAREAAKKEAKMASMGLLGRIFKFIINLLLAIVSILTMNPVGLTVAIMGMMDAVKPEIQVFKKVFNGIAQVVKDAMPFLPPKMQKAMEDWAKYVFIVASGGLAVMIALPDLLAASDIIKDMAMSTGKSEEAAAAAQQTAILAITLSVTLIVVLATLIFTAGVSLAALLPELMGSVGRAMLSVAESMEGLMMTGGKYAQNAMALATIMGDLCSGVSSGLTVGQSIIKRDLALIMAKVKEAKELTDADLENLLKLIKKLLAMLSGDAGYINFISDIQSHILASVGETTTSMTSV